MSEFERNTDTTVRFLLGIDGGGTCCRAQLVSLQGEVLGVGESGPANALRNAAQAQQSILAATELAFRDGGLGPTEYRHAVAGVGLAGANVPAAFQAISHWGHPFHAMHLTTDMQIACYGANGSRDGGVIISGTGCSGYSSVAGEQRVHSAFGFPFGDTGGAAWIGLSALRAAFLALDKLGPDTVLVDDIQQFLGATGIGIVEQLANAQPYDYGRLSPLVFAAAANDDKVAESIVAESADHISTLARSIWALGPTRLSLVGGLAATIAPWLAADVLDLLSPALHSPLEGAILYAREQLTGTQGSPESFLPPATRATSTGGES